MSAPQAAAPAYTQITPGDPAPWFQQRTSGHDNYKFHTAAGRYVVMAFHMTASDVVGAAVIEALERTSDLFDGACITAFAVSADPEDEARLRPRPGVTYIWDFDGEVSRLYGALPNNPGGTTARRFWLVLDPTLRVMAVFPIVGEDGRPPRALFDFLRKLPPPEVFAGFELQAPILFLPQVFERGLCRDLIAYYEARGGQETGVMRQKGDETVAVIERAHKSRFDCLLDDPNLVRHVQGAIGRRVVPEIRKAYQFNVTHMERYLIGCYDAKEGGHFAPHRDNTSGGTVHRRFAISVNLNEDFDGGTLNFPEYSSRQYKPPAGAAVVFSCSLMHMVAPVTHGKRYAFLPFLHDDAAEAERRRNLGQLAGGGQHMERRPAR